MVIFKYFSTTVFEIEKLFNIRFEVNIFQGKHSIFAQPCLIVMLHADCTTLSLRARKNHPILPLSENKPGWKVPSLHLHFISDFEMAQSVSISGGSIFGTTDS